MSESTTFSKGQLDSFNREAARAYQITKERTHLNIY